MFESTKATDGITKRRGMKDEMEARIPMARTFIDETIDAMVAHLKLDQHNEKVPSEYFGDAGEKMKREIDIHVGRDTRDWRRKPEDEVWMLVWSFRSTPRATWSMTEMVVRTDGTLNTEWLFEKVRHKAWSAYESAQRDMNWGRAFHAWTRAGSPGDDEDDYTVEPTSHAGTPLYGVKCTAYRQSGNLGLDTEVRLENIEPVIEAHKVWVAALTRLTT